MIDPDEERAEIANVTNFKTWVNRTDSLVKVYNRETPGDNHTIPKHDTRNRDLWVPWCDRRRDFGSRRVEIDVLATGKTYFVWQSGSSVRYSENGSWSKDGAGVPGHSEPGGDRRVIIGADGALTVEVA